MRAAALVLVSFAAGLSAGCGPKIRAKSYWATTAYRMDCGSTYAWNENNRVEANGQVDPGLISFLEHRIETELALLCYEQRTQSDEADFLITYHAGAAFQPTSSGPTNMGLLAVEAHTGDGRLIWRGWAEAALSTFTTPELRRDRLEETIRVIMREFHPECFREGDPPACHCS